MENLGIDAYTKIAYAEVCQVLTYVDNAQLKKIPKKILKFFYENREKGYVSKIDKNDIFNKNNISLKALSILAYINLNYWASEEHKRELKKLYQINELKEDEKKRKKYPIDIFKNKRF